MPVPDGQQQNNRSRSPSAARQTRGVDDTPTPRISLNFTSEPASEFSGDRLSRESSVDKQWEPRKTVAAESAYGDEDDADGDGDGDADVAVDTSSTCRVSDNFRGTEQYHALNPMPVTAIERRHSTVKEEESEVDTTPFCRVSDSLRVAAYDGPPAVRKKSQSRDAKKSETVGTDSGSEVSDEGYRSLGVVTTPPSANSNAKCVQKFNGKQYYAVNRKKVYIICYTQQRK